MSQLVSALDLPAMPTGEQLEVIQKYLGIQLKANSISGYGKKNYYDERKEIIGKKLIIFKHPQKKREIWYMRLYVGNKKYKTISLKTSNQGLAIERALDNWRTLQNHIDEGGNVFELSTSETLNQYLLYLNELVDTKQIKKLTMTCKHTSLRKLRLFLEDYERPSQIPANVLRNYISWRRTKNWDKKKHKNNLAPPTDQTINRELSDFKGYFDWMRVNRHYLCEIDIPFMKIDWKKNNEKNPSFDVNDWLEILKYMKKWSIKRENRKEYGIFYRQLFCQFLKILANSGLRPHEALLLKWSDIVLRKKEEIEYKKVSNFGNNYEETYEFCEDTEDFSSQRNMLEYVFDTLDPEENPNGSPTRYKNTVTKMIVHIQVSPHTKTGRRLVICPAGFFFTRIKDMYVKKLGRSPSQNDFVFMNIGTSNSRKDEYVGRAITSDHFRKLWYEMIQDLRSGGGTLFDKHYTIYSCRSYFINQRLEMGVSPHLVAKLVGHSIKTMERHYEDIQLKRLEPELVEMKRRRIKQAEYELYEIS